MRRLVTLTILLAGLYAVLMYVRRRNRAGRERVDLFYDDGSHVTIADEAAEPFLDAARSALSAEA